MKTKKLFALILAVLMMLSVCACGVEETASDGDVTVTDMIGREVAVTPGSYKNVVCIGAGALRMYCYVCDTSLLCGVEDIDNLSLSERPQMFDTVARPYMLAFSDVFSSLPSCGVGGPNAQSAAAEISAYPSAAARVIISAPWRSAVPDLPRKT